MSTGEHVGCTHELWHWVGCKPLLSISGCEDHLVPPKIALTWALEHASGRQPVAR